MQTEAGETVALSAVVSNMDSVRTYRELVQGAPAAKFAKRWKREAACSGVVLYLGLDRAYEHLAHHDFVFSRDPEEEFDFIYRRGEPAPDPTCYIAAPSRTEPGVAPPGGEALYVLVHTPYLRPHHDWSKMLPGYRRVILDKLARTAGLKDLESRIRFERVLTPQDIHERYRVLDGAIYGLASHGRFFGAFKPGNRSRDLAGLYLAGGAAHPGPGMPMVLMSGWIAADALDHDLVGGRRAGGGMSKEPPDPLAARSPNSAHALRLVSALLVRAASVRRGARLPRRSAAGAAGQEPRHLQQPCRPGGTRRCTSCSDLALLPDRIGYGPMETRELQRYGLLRRMGVFGIDPTSPGALRSFSMGRRRILADPARHALGDRRGALHRSPRAAGDAAAGDRASRAACARTSSSCRSPSNTASGTRAGRKPWPASGPPVAARGGVAIRPTSPATLTTGLTANDGRAGCGIDRARSRAVPNRCLRGGVGVGGIYDAWRRLRAWSTGRRFDPAHARRSVQGGDL